MIVRPLQIEIEAEYKPSRLEFPIMSASCATVQQDGKPGFGEISINNQPTWEGE